MFSISVTSRQIRFQVLLIKTYYCFYEKFTQNSSSRLKSTINRINKKIVCNNIIITKISFHLCTDVKSIFMFYHFNGKELILNKS